MNHKFIGHYSLGFSLPFLKKLIVENQIFLQTFSWDETMVNNAEDCNSIIFFPKITTGAIKSFGWVDQGSINNQICNASTGISVLFVLAFLICLGLFFFRRKQQRSLENAITPLIILIVSGGLVKMLEILIYGF